MEFTFFETIGLILIIGLMGLIFFKMYLKSKNGSDIKSQFIDRKKNALPIKLQAYERMVLFCDRINPLKLVVRVSPIDSSSNDYLVLLLKSIEQEFEYNSTQQLYVSNKCWDVVIASKTSVINTLKQIAVNSNNAQELREKLILEYQHKTPPTDTAIAFIKSEVKKII